MARSVNGLVFGGVIVHKKIIARFVLGAVLLTGPAGLFLSWHAQGTVVGAAFLLMGASVTLVSVVIAVFWAFNNA